MGLPVFRETISTPRQTRARSGCAMMASICFLSDPVALGGAADAARDKKKQQIRAASGALFFNIYKPDCSTGAAAPLPVQLESQHTCAPSSPGTSARARWSLGGER